MSVEYTKGLHELGDGLWAYLQPRGQWGYSNAGLVVGDGDSLLVDTLFDLNLTRQMLEQMKPITGVQPWNPDRVGRPDQQLAHGRSRPRSLASAPDPILMWEKMGEYRRQRVR
jgi:hypothetical protein